MRGVEVLGRSIVFVIVTQVFKEGNQLIQQKRNEVVYRNPKTRLNGMEYLAISPPK